VTHKSPCQTILTSKVTLQYHNYYLHIWQQKKINRVMSFRSHKTHTVTLISVSLALSQTSVYTARPQIQGQCIAQHACLWPSFWWYLFRLCTDDGQAELTWVAGYIPKKFIRHRQSRIGPSVILLIETGMLPLNHAATHSIKYKVEYIPVEVMRTIAGNDNNWNV